MAFVLAAWPLGWAETTSLDVVPACRTEFAAWGLQQPRPGQKLIAVVNLLQHNHGWSTFICHLRCDLHSVADYAGESLLGTLLVPFFVLRQMLRLKRRDIRVTAHAAPRDNRR